MRWMVAAAAVLPLLLLLGALGIQGGIPTSADAVPATTPEHDPVPPTGVRPLFVRAAQDFGVPESLLLAVAAEESGFDAHARSSAGALGIMQMLPSTFAEWAGRLGLSPTADPTDPTVEIPVAAAKLAADGAATGQLEAALHAYNPDDAYVARVLARQRDYEAWLSGPNVPPGAATAAFPFGECTWYAAQQHAVTWSGDAKDWIANAAAKGIRSTSIPSVGAIAVYAPGGAGRYDHAHGHVAIVTDVGPTAYTVTEMNYAGFGLVDSRTLRLPDPDALGFIP